MPNQRAIAAKAGVTQAAVSKALRGDPSIAEETRKQIHAIAEAMGYRAKNKPSFGAVLDEVSPDVWSQWDERLKDEAVR